MYISWRKSHYFWRKSHYIIFFLYLCSDFYCTTMNIDDNSNWLKKERDKAILAIHTRIINDSGINKKYLTRDIVAKKIQECSAPRFYIDTRQCRYLVRAYYNGKLDKSSPLCQAKAKDLAEVFEKIRETHPNDYMEDIFGMVVQQPAKSFYLSKSRIIEILYRYHDRK